MDDCFARNRMQVEQHQKSRYGCQPSKGKSKTQLNSPDEQSAVWVDDATRATSAKTLKAGLKIQDELEEGKPAAQEELLIQLSLDGTTTTAGDQPDPSVRLSRQFGIVKHRGLIMFPIVPSGGNASCLLKVSKIDIPIGSFRRP